MMAAKRALVVESVKLGTVAEALPDFPGLDHIGPKIARGLSAAFAMSGGMSKVGRGDIRTMSFRDWKAGLPGTVAVARYRARGMKGGAMLSVPPALLATLVDIFYGGDGAIDTKHVICGAAEQRLFDRIATAAGEAISLAWAEVQQLTLTLETTIFASEDLTFGKTDDTVVVHRFAIDDLHAGAPAAEIVYPLAALRGIAGLHGTVEAVDDVPDPAWRMRLSDAVMQSRLPVRTVIVRPTLPLSCLISLAPGDFIPVTLPARVPLTVAGRLLAHGTIGEANGRAAIMIDKIEPGVLHD
jgi:flagellar motor switch protein FliM